MNYVTNTFLLVSSLVQSKQISDCVLCRARPKNRTKTYNKELYQVSVITIPLY